jgi:uncharacterized protein YlaI
MIASVYHTSPGVVERVLVYDLGLTTLQKQRLTRIEKVEVLGLPDYTLDFYPGYREPKQYAWKMCCIKEARQYGDLVFWLDSGIACLRNMREIYDEIDRDHIFLVNNSNNHPIRTHLSPECERVMKMTDEEKNAPMISAGVQGYKTNGFYQDYVDDGFQWSQVKEAVHGSHANHRHDQTIYSVLAHRHGLSDSLHDVEVYAQWRGISVVPNQFFYVHRRQYQNTRGF